MSLAAAIDKKCSQCGGVFHPRSSTQRVCSQRCAMRAVKADKLAEREHTKARKEKIKTIPDLIKEAQRAFNAWVRARDRNKTCICCGKGLGQGAVGGNFDAGHFRSVGSAPHLRFDERNCHAQRKHCNRYGAGRAVDYRAGLIVRIGVEAVEALESDNRIHKWTRDELIAIRATYRQKLKELQKEAA